MSIFLNLVVYRFSELLNDASHSVFVRKRSFWNRFAQKLAYRLPAVLESPNEQLFFWAIVDDVLVVHPKKHGFKSPPSVAKSFDKIKMIDRAMTTGIFTKKRKPVFHPENVHVFAVEVSGFGADEKGTNPVHVQAHCAGRMVEDPAVDSAVETPPHHFFELISLDLEMPGHRSSPFLFVTEHKNH